MTLIDLNRFCDDLRKPDSYAEDEKIEELCYNVMRFTNREINLVEETPLREFWEKVNCESSKFNGQIRFKISL